MTKTTLKISGNVLSVLEGTVTPSALHPIASDQFRFALGAGTFSDPSRIGETIIIESRPYVSWVEESELLTMSIAEVHSPFLLGIEGKQTADSILHFKSFPHTSFQDFYAELAKKYPMGVAIVGLALISKLHTTYLKKPPIFHENVNENHSTYWSDVAIEDQRPICFFGVVIPPEAKKKFPKGVLEKAFYQNPGETQVSPFDSHTHALLLKSSLESWPKDLDSFFQNLKDLPFFGVRHMLTQSLIQEGVFALFPIEMISAN